MLKFLRKYNQWILVVGGSLLMIAFLLPQTLDQLRHTRLGGSVMRMAGSRISSGEFDRFNREYHLLNTVTAGAMSLVGGPESAEHWIMLTRLAEEGGFVGGRRAGKEYIPELARGLAAASGRIQNQQQLDQFSDTFTQAIEQGLPEQAAQLQLSLDEAYEALGKLQGVIRMRAAYYQAPRYSDRRLIAEAKQRQDQARVAYVFVPAAREVGAVPEPDEQTLRAFYEKYKSVAPAEAEYGVGYLLPDRVKIAYLQISRQDIEEAVNADPVEVRKRYLKKYREGAPPEGTTPEQAQAEIEAEVKAEQVRRVAQIAEQTVRAEIEKSLRRLDEQGGYRVLPEDWDQHRPGFERIAQAVVDRVRDAAGVTLPLPTVRVENSRWLEMEDLFTLPGIGRATRAGANFGTPFYQLALQVREIAGPNAEGLQVGVPYHDFVETPNGSRYVFMVLDARKSSPPDSFEDVRDRVAQDWRSVEAFRILQSKESQYRETAVAQGLEAVARNAENPTAPESNLLVREATVTRDGVNPFDGNVETETFRETILAAAARLDATADIAALNRAQRVVTVPLPKSRGLAVAQINGVTPLTLELFQRNQARYVRQLQSEQLQTRESDPFSQKRLEERLEVEYPGREQPDPATNPPAAT